MPEVVDTGVRTISHKQHKNPHNREKISRFDFFFRASLGVKQVKC